MVCKTLTSASRSQEFSISFQEITAVPTHPSTAIALGVRTGSRNVVCKIIWNMENISQVQ